MHIFFFSAGVAFALPVDLFLQAWRPAAFVVSGTIGWLSMFVVGMCFSYVVVRHATPQSAHIVSILIRFYICACVCVHVEWTGPVLLPDFRDLLHRQWSLHDLFGARDQRKDDVGDYGGLQQT